MAADRAMRITIVVIVAMVLVLAALAAWLRLEHPREDTGHEADHFLLQRSAVVMQDARTSPPSRPPG